MAHRIHSRQEKLKLYKKLTITIAAVIIFCLAAVIVFRAIDRQKLRKQEAYEAEQGVVRINGKKYLPKKNIETYLFMGIDSLDKVKKAELQNGYICEWVFANEDGRVHAPVISSCIKNNAPCE